MPNHKTTPKGTPTRWEKIRYLLRLKGVTSDVLETFVERNIEDIIALFDVLNRGTHGSAGSFDLTKLFSIKKRAEDGIEFFTSIVFQPLVCKSPDSQRSPRFSGPRAGTVGYRFPFQEYRAARN